MCSPMRTRSWRPSKAGSGACPIGATLVANVGDPGVEAVLDRLRDWPGTILAYALVDQAPQRLGGYARAIGERFATVARPRDRAPRPGHRQRSGVDHARAPRPRPTGRDRSRRGCRRPVATTRPTPSRSPAPRPCWAWHPDAVGAGLASFEGHRPAPRTQGRGRRCRGLRRLRPPPDGDPRDARRRPPARAGPAGLGRLRAADLPPDGGDARRLRRCPVRRGRRGHRRHLGRSRSRHDDRLGGRAGVGRRRAQAGPDRPRARDRSRPPRTALP